MPAPPPDARQLTARVAEVRPCGADAVVLSLEPDVELPPIRASRFFMLRRDDALSPLIPRPYSIYRQPPGRLEFLIQVIGRGSRALEASRPGETIHLTGPLGNGWPTLDGDGDPWVMLAGGVGSAPFLMGIDQALSGMDGATACRPSQVHYLFGARSAGHLYDLDAFRATGASVHTATVDGSAPAGLTSHRGHVLSLLAELQAAGTIPDRVRLLACGPEPMLEAVEHLAAERDLPAWLSLETLMGCGIGICNGCPVPTRPDGPLGDWPNAKACVEGPVFEARAVTLEGV